MLLEQTRLAKDVDPRPILKRGPAVFDDAMKRLDERPVKTPDLLGRQRSRLAVVPEASIKQDLVGVNRTDTHDHFSVGQELLERSVVGFDEVTEREP